MHRHAARPHARHVSARRAGRGHAPKALVAAAALAAAAFAVGPASAHELGSPGFSVSASAATTLSHGDWSPGTGAEDAFGQMLADARARKAAAARAERHRVLEVRQERRARLANKRARALAAKVRASRAALRSTVVRPIGGGYHLTARFDDGGSLWGSGRHTGLDFACSVGTPVHVVADGVVATAGYDGAYGNRIEVRHADGTVTTYNHLSAILVHAGRVHAGEVIGRVGSTGNTTGAHLHFEVMRGGAYVDPEKWLRARYVTY